MGKKSTESNEMIDWSAIRLTPEEWALQKGMRIEIAKGAFLNAPKKLIGETEFDEGVKIFMDTPAEY
jgi:hypothetical protein